MTFRDGGDRFGPERMLFTEIDLFFSSFSSSPVLLERPSCRRCDREAGEQVLSLKCLQLMFFNMYFFSYLFLILLKLKAQHSGIEIAETCVCIHLRHPPPKPTHTTRIIMLHTLSNSIKLHKIAYIARCCYCSPQCFCLIVPPH